MNNISLLSLARLALRYIYVLIATALVFAAAAFAYCKFVAVPKYSATGSVLVTNGAIITGSDTDGTSSKKVSTTDISASLYLVDTISEILQTNGIYKELAESTGEEFTYADLKSRVTVSRRSDETMFIDISFVASTAEEAKFLTNSFLELAPDYISKFIPNSTTAVTTNADNASLIYPRTVMTAGMAGIIGAVLSFGVVYIISLLNTTIKDEDDIKENYKLTVIGSIPDFSNAASGGYYKYGYGRTGRSRKGGGSNGR